MGKSQTSGFLGLAKGLDEGWHGRDCDSKSSLSSSRKVILAFAGLSVGRLEGLFSREASSSSKGAGLWD